MSAPQEDENARFDHESDDNKSDELSKEEEEGEEDDENCKEVALKPLDDENNELIVRIDGIVRVIAGYSGGSQPNPNYECILDHTESLWIEFDPKQVNLETLLYEWTRMHKPTKQQYSTGQYRSFVGYLSDAQRKIADLVIDQWKERLSPLYTSVEQAGSFYQAEDYHQDYYIKTGQARFVH